MPFKDECRICGTKRQRNLIVEYTKKKGQTILAYLVDKTTGDKWVICRRCQMLLDSGYHVEDLRMFPGLISGQNPKYRYKDGKQIWRTKND